MHYYNLTHEASGRSGAGGVLDPHEVRLLTQAVHRHDHVHAGSNGKQRDPVVEYTMDEEEYFWNRYNSLLKRIHNKTDEKGKPIYFPWKARTYKVSNSQQKMGPSRALGWLLTNASRPPVSHHGG